MVERAVCVAAGRRALVVCVPRLLGSVGSDTRRPELGVGASAPASVRHAGPDLMLRRCWEANSVGGGRRTLSAGGTWPVLPPAPRRLVHPFPLVMCHVVGSSDGQASGASGLGR